jgi:hypothetical protein
MEFFILPPESNLSSEKAFILTSDSKVLIMEFCILIEYMHWEPTK